MVDQTPVRRAMRIAGTSFSSLVELETETKSDVEKLIDRALRTSRALTAKLQEREAEIDNKIRTISETQLTSFIDEEKINRAAEAIVLLLDESARIRRDFDALTPWLVDFVGDCLRRITGEMEATDLVSRMVREAAAELDAKQALCVRIHKSDMVPMQQAMAQFPERFCAVDRLLIDPELPKGQIILEGAGGLLSIDIETQISALTTHLAKTLSAEGKS